MVSISAWAPARDTPGRSRAHPRRKNAARGCCSSEYAAGIQMSDSLGNRHPRGMTPTTVTGLPLMRMARPMRLVSAP